MFLASFDMTVPDELKVVKVAIIGSGLAGLTAAYFLATSASNEVRFEVHLFEKVRSSLLCPSLSRAKTL